MPYMLFSATKTTGRSHTLAMFSASWKLPVLDAPSPKKQSTTRSVPWSFCASAAPTATGMLPPTMPVAPRLPCATSAMCMEPPLPLQ